MKKFLKEIIALGWAIIGGLFVIITLSGDVKRTAILLTVLGVAIQLSGLLIPEDKEEEEK
jgi:hypothetical protein